VARGSVQCQRAEVDLGIVSVFKLTRGRTFNPPAFRQPINMLASSIKTRADAIPATAFAVNELSPTGNSLYPPLLLKTRTCFASPRDGVLTDFNPELLAGLPPIVPIMTIPEPTDPESSPLLQSVIMQKSASKSIRFLKFVFYCYIRLLLLNGYPGTGSELR